MFASACTTLQYFIYFALHDFANIICYQTLEETNSKCHFESLSSRYVMHIQTKLNFKIFQKVFAVRAETSKIEHAILDFEPFNLINNHYIAQKYRNA